MQVETKIAEIINAKAQIMEGLVTSPCKTFEQYNQRVGEWQGLDRALKIIVNEPEDKG